MTCIAGMVDENGKIWMAADSAGVAGDQIAVRVDEKIFWKDEYLIGCTGSFRMMQILRFEAVLPEIPHELVDEDLFAFMVMHIVPAIRKSFDEHGWLVKDKEQENGGGHFMIAVRGRLFTIEADFQVAEDAGAYCAIGSGALVARGAFFATEGMNPKHRVRLAIEAAAHHISSVRGPIHTVTNAEDA